MKFLKLNLINIQKQSIISNLLALAFTIIFSQAIAQNGCLNVAWEADYHYYQLHGSNTESRINGIINQVESMFKNSGVQLSLSVVQKNIIQYSSQDPYGASSINNYIGNVLDQTISRGYTRGSVDVTLLFSGKKLSNHGAAYPNNMCSSSSCAVGIGVNKTQGYRLTTQQEAQIHAHEITHLLTDGTHDDIGVNLMNSSTPYTGASKFSNSRVNSLNQALSSKSCLSCGNSTPPITNNNCTLTVSNPTGCEFYFTVNNITYSLPANGNYIFNVANGAGFSLLYTNWNVIESRSVSCSNPNYSIPTNLCGGGVVSNPCTSPSYLSASGITSNSCSLSWDAGIGATSYVVYQLFNSSWYKLADAYGTSIGIGGMASGSAYVFAVESVCGNTGSGSYTQTTVYTNSFRTSGNTTLNSGELSGLYIIEENSSDLKLGDEMKVYPNPAQYKAIIEFELATENYVDIIVTDAIGKAVINLVGESKSKGKHFVNFETAHLPEGIYFCKIEAGDFVKIQKLMVVK